MADIEEDVKETGVAAALNKDILTFDDGDGELHLYVAAAFRGERWAAQLVFEEDKRTEKEVKWQGDFLISATIRSLIRANIISKKGQ